MKYLLLLIFLLALPMIGRSITADEAYARDSR